MAHCPGFPLGERLTHTVVFRVFTGFSAACLNDSMLLHLKRKTSMCRGATTGTTQVPPPGSSMKIGQLRLPHGKESVEHSKVLRAKHREAQHSMCLRRLKAAGNGSRDPRWPRVFQEGSEKLRKAVAHLTGNTKKARATFNQDKWIEFYVSLKAK